METDSITPHPRIDKHSWQMPDDLENASPLLKHIIW